MSDEIILEERILGFIKAIWCYYINRRKRRVLDKNGKYCGYGQHELIVGIDHFDDGPRWWRKDVCLRCNTEIFTDRQSGMDQTITETEWAKSHEYLKELDQVIDSLKGKYNLSCLLHYHGDIKYYLKQLKKNRQNTGNGKCYE